MVSLLQHTEKSVHDPLFKGTCPLFLSRQNPGLHAANFPTACFLPEDRSPRILAWDGEGCWQNQICFASPPDLGAHSLLLLPIWAAAVDINELSSPGLLSQLWAGQATYDSHRCFFFLIKKKTRYCFSFSRMISVRWIKLATQNLNEIPRKLTCAS